MTADFKGPSGSIPIESTQWDSSWPGLASQADRRRLLSYMEERFGIPQSTWEGYRLFCRRRTWWLLADSSHVERACRLKVSAVGLKAFEKVGAFVKPTTRFIQLFGRAATKRVVELTGHQLRLLTNAEIIQVDERDENGYMILSFQGHVLGLGLLIDGGLRSQLQHFEISDF